MMPKGDRYIPYPVDTTEVVLPNTAAENQASALANQKANRKKKFVYAEGSFVPKSESSYREGAFWMTR